MPVGVDKFMLFVEVEQHSYLYYKCLSVNSFYFKLSFFATLITPFYSSNGAEYIVLLFSLLRSSNSAMSPRWICNSVTTEPLWFIGQHSILGFDYLDFYYIEIIIKKFKF